MISVLRTTILVVLSLALAGVGSGQKPTLTAAEIVQRMTSKYANLTGYQDSGTVELSKDDSFVEGLSWEQVLTSDKFQPRRVVSFSLSFVRPDKLRFEWNNLDKAANRKSVVWWNHKRIYSWLPSSVENDDMFIWYAQPSIARAIDEAGQSSSSVLMIIHNLLTRGNEYFSFTKMTQPKIIREETVDGNSCYVIVGNISDDPWALWIDKNSFLLRKYRMQIATGSFDESVRTGVMPVTIGEIRHHNIEINARISNSVFDFRPTLKKGDMNISRPKRERLIAPPLLSQEPKKSNEQ